MHAALRKHVTMRFRAAPRSARALALLIFASAIALLSLSATGGAAASWYVDSATGDDSNPGTSPGLAWRSLRKVQDMQWWKAEGGLPWFGPGDTIYLSGTFSQGFYIAMGQAWGNATHPLTVTSRDPTKRALIKVAGDDGIAMWELGNSAPRLGIRITDLNIQGDGKLGVAGVTTSGIIAWKRTPGSVDGLEIRRVNVSGFTFDGISTGREPGAGFIRNVVISDSYLFSNPGAANIRRPIGSGVCLGGVQYAVVERCVGFDNGAANNSPGGGPSAFWAWDSEYVVFRNSTAYENKTSLKDGGGFELDLAVNHSVIEFCNTYNNYGFGLYICTVADTPNNFNNTIRHSNSTGDANRVGFAGIALYAPAGTYMQDTSIYGNTVTIVDPNLPCRTWGWQGDGHYAFSAWGDHRNTKWFNNRVICQPSGQVWSQNLTCRAIGNPPIQPSCELMTETLQLPPWAANPNAPPPSGAPGPQFNRTLSALQDRLPSPSPQPVAAAASAAADAGTTYYVDAANGSDANDGRSPGTAWRTLDKVSAMTYSSSSGSSRAQPGDRFLLQGTFTKTLWISLHSKSLGTAAAPITIASADPRRRATIAPADGDAITIYEAADDPAPAIGLRITDLNLVGDGELDSTGRPDAGVSFWRGGSNPVDGLEIRRVNATGFTRAGIYIGRSEGAGYIRDVVVADAFAFNNPGAPSNVSRSQMTGGGISLVGVQGALVERCVAFGNGARNDDAWNSPVGIGASLSDGVVIRNCSSFNNTGAYVYASGFGLDLGTSNSVIEFCSSANNYGSGYQARSRSRGATSNNTIRYSTSDGDGNGSKVASISVWADEASGGAVNDLSVYSTNVTISDPLLPCKLWGSDLEKGPYALSLYGPQTSTRWFDNRVVCKQDGGAAVPGANASMTCTYLTSWKAQTCWQN